MIAHQLCILSHCQSDPYVSVKVGKKVKDNREDFIANNLKPVFGQLFEVEAELPFDRTLTVTVMDHDVVNDEVIGSTTIDLENRFLSLYRAQVGLPQTFHM